MHKGANSSLRGGKLTRVPAEKGDEVYCVYSDTALSGYNERVVLQDDLILTIAGTTDAMAARETWDGASGHTVLTAIRWTPE
ncbi:MAG: hypothetical protein V1800_12245 [Candidatus Latescibacterota bacterium]